MAGRYTRPHRDRSYRADAVLAQRRIGTLLLK
jgi:hypothetical protein